MIATKILLLLASLLVTVHAYWLGDISHQGRAPYAPSGYKVFRNVKDYGARGDGSTDDYAAIQAAIDDGGACGKGCAGTTTHPVVVYFPAGTYSLSQALRPGYHTSLVGDAGSPPTLKATSNFAGFGVIDGDSYYTSTLNWGSTTVFYRQVRNFIIDTRSIPAGNAATGIHWPTAQATSLQNIVFNLPTASNTVHVAIFIEEGSAGYMGDLTFNGGNLCLQAGNQQFTARNLVFNNCKTAIQQIWNWGFTYQGISINNCGLGFDLTPGGTGAVAVGSMTILDSTISNTPVGIKTVRTSGSSPKTGDSLVLENVKLTNVPTAIQGPSGTILNGGSTTISAWASGQRYTPSGPQTAEGSITAVSRPASLLNGANYRAVSMPQYTSLAASSIMTAHSQGAKGDSATDDTSALQNGINAAASQNKVFYIEFGVYRVTNTITVPPGSRIVGEGYPIILASGSNFASQSSPRAVLKVGSSSGQSGRAEIQNLVMSTQGPTAGAILIEWNLASDASNPSGMWDVHTRIGGFTGSNLQAQQCAKNPGNNSPPSQCIAAFMSMHVTAGASGLYMENCWLWTADHDIDGTGQVDIYTGRGLLVESTAGNIWLVGTAVEHHALYQYSFVGTKNIYMGFIQTESAYYQPTPVVPAPFSINSGYKDPSFPSDLKSGWGVYVKDSSAVSVYGAGLYSFFSSWDTTCNTIANGAHCQPRIFDIENSRVSVYNLNTVGTQQMFTVNGQNKASFSDNPNNFASTISMLKS